MDGEFGGSGRVQGEVRERGGSSSTPLSVMDIIGWSGLALDDKSDLLIANLSIETTNYSSFVFVINNS